MNVLDAAARSIAELDLDGDFGEKEREYGTVYSISEPFIVVAENMIGSGMYELVRVGHGKMVGEVIRLNEGGTVTIQVFEDITGKLKIGDLVQCARKPLTLDLGPGLIGSIFDGLQRPLDRQFESISIADNLAVEALDMKKTWEFIPNSAAFRIGSHICGGDVFGVVPENSIFKHKIMLPPGSQGVVTFIAEPGEYCLKDKILVIEYHGRVHSFGLYQAWPIRTPRPVTEKLLSDQPLVTGLRVLDSLFPCSFGATVTIPGPGCGKATLFSGLAKHADVDATIFVGSGARTTEMAELLLDFTQLTTNVGDSAQSIMKRSAVIANTVSTPAAVCEASLNTGLVFAEYVRDMGYNVSLLADSTSRWAEALREVSGRLGEIPADSGYPVFLKARLASLYERAGKVVCLGSPNRHGSVTIFSSVSPGGDYSEPVTSCTLDLVKVFWKLDIKLAQRKHFPSINWLDSFSSCAEALRPHFDTHWDEFVSLRAKIKEILCMEDSLAESVRQLGENALAESDQLGLDIAALLRNDFLQQNIFWPYDSFCPFYKTVWMMRNFLLFYGLAQKAIAGSSKDHRLSWTRLKKLVFNEWDALQTMKFQNPSEGRDIVEKHMREVGEMCMRAFEKLNDEQR